MTGAEPVAVHRIVNCLEWVMDRATAAIEPLIVGCEVYSTLSSVDPATRALMVDIAMRSAALISVHRRRQKHYNNLSRAREGLRRMRHG